MRWPLARALLLVVAAILLGAALGAEPWTDDGLREFWGRVARKYPYP